MGGKGRETEGHGGTERGRKLKRGEKNGRGKDC